MKVAVIAWIGSTNLGDDLIFAALIELLGEFNVRPQDITAFSTNPEDTSRKFGVHSVGHLDPVATLRVLSACDLVIFGGGGLIQDETSAWNLPYYYGRLWLARWLGKPIVTLGVGVGPLKTRLGRWLTRITLRGQDAVVLRDPKSRDELVDLGVRQATVGADLVFGMKPVAGEPKPYLAVSLRHYAPRSRVLPVSLSKSEAGESVTDLLASVLDEAADRTGLAIRFVSFDTDQDFAFHRKIADRMVHAVTFATPSTNDVIEAIGSASVVLAMRFHAGVIATMAGRPSVLIGYSPKIYALEKMVGSACRAIPNEVEAFTDLPRLLVEVAAEEVPTGELRARLESATAVNRSAVGRVIENLGARASD